MATGPDGAASPGVLAEPKRRRRWPLVLGSALGAAVLALLAFSFFSGLGRGEPVDVPLEQVPQSLSKGDFGGVPLFVYRDEDEVTVFHRISPGGAELTWCAAEGVFFTAVTGEAFDLEGRYVDGPAQRDMDRVSSEIKRGEGEALDELRIWPEDVIRAEGRGEGEAPRYTDGSDCGASAL